MSYPSERTGVSYQTGEMSRANPELITGSWSAATSFTTPSWPAGRYRYVKLHLKTDAFNGGALCQVFGRFIGPAGGTYRSGGTWSSGVSGAGTFTISSNGSPGGLAALLLQDQLNNALAIRSVDLDIYPLDGTFDALGKAYDVAGSSVSRTNTSNYTTDTTPPTAFRVDFPAACSGTYWLLGYR